jgi:tRNA pseudouridine38-40 synthase
VRVRLELSYDGTEFAGWAVQPGRRTVQGELQSALAAMLRQPALTLTVAGRTDAGVHASGQVAHVDVARETWDDISHSLLHRLASMLPADVRVTGAVEAAPGFDARFGALWRHYEYRITDAEAGADPLRRTAVLWWRRRLDATAMNETARSLVGLHDFAAFCRQREGASTIRTLQSFSVQRDDRGEIVCSVRADAFCHSMVRSLVGALLAVGEGRRDVGWPASLLTRDLRADDVQVAPAHGLTLVEVGYPPDGELAERARLTRAKRSRDE